MPRALLSWIPWIIMLLAACRGPQEPEAAPASESPESKSPTAATPAISRPARLGRESKEPPRVDDSDTRFDPARTDLGVRFSLLAPTRVLSAQQLPVVVRVLDPDGRVHAGASGWVRLETTPGGRLEETEVLLRRGVGSITTSVAATADFELRVGSGPRRNTQLVRVARPAVRRLSGTLQGDQLHWAAGSEIEIVDDLTVPPDTILTVESGSTIRIGPAVNLLSLGDLQVRGSAAAPVLFLPLEPGRPWGGWMHAGHADYSYTVLLGGGGDPSRRFGHSASQAVIFARPGAEVNLDHCAIQDSPGKGIGASQATLRLRDSLVTRTDMGGELMRSEVVIERSHFLDFPAIGAPFRDDDNDALYLRGVMLRDGQEIPSIVRDSVFIGGLDDAIDHLRARVEIYGSWIHGFSHEGIAALGAGSVHVEDTAISGCEQGLEAGTGRPRVTADRVLLFGNDIGARYGDAYGNSCRGSLQIRNSVIVGNRRHALWNYLHRRRGPSPIGIELLHSLVDEKSWDRGEGNVVGQARLTDQLLLAPDSPGRGAAEGGSDPGLRAGRPR